MVYHTKFFQAKIAAAGKLCKNRGIVWPTFQIKFRCREGVAVPSQHWGRGMLAAHQQTGHSTQNLSALRDHSRPNPCQISHILVWFVFCCEEVGAWYVVWGGRRWADGSCDEGIRAINVLFLAIVPLQPDLGPLCPAFAIFYLPPLMLYKKIIQ